MNATADRCQEKAGFLFSHACSRAQEASCDDCGKQTCEKHSRTEDDHTRCITCAKKTLKLGGRPTKSKSRQRQRYRDDGVGAEARLVRRAIQRDELFVDRVLEAIEPVRGETALLQRLRGNCRVGRRLEHTVVQVDCLKRPPLSAPKFGDAFLLGQLPGQVLPLVRIRMKITHAHRNSRVFVLMLIG